MCIINQISINKMELKESVCRIQIKTFGCEELDSTTPIYIQVGACTQWVDWLGGKDHKMLGDDLAAADNDYPKLLEQNNDEITCQDKDEKKMMMEKGVGNGYH